MFDQHTWRGPRHITDKWRYLVIFLELHIFRQILLKNLTENVQFQKKPPELRTLSVWDCRHLSATSSVFHPNMQHPQFYTLSISSLILHFCHSLPCLIIPWISSCTISNSIRQNVISSQPFHPQLKCLLFHPCIFHPINSKDGMNRMKMKGWICKYEINRVKNLGWAVQDEVSRDETDRRRNIELWSFFTCEKIWKSSFLECKIKQEI